jgi:hypothetical protein
MSNAKDITINIGGKPVRMTLNIFPDGSALRAIDEADETRKEEFSKQPRIIAHDANGRIIRYKPPED